LAGMGPSGSSSALSFAHTTAPLVHGGPFDSPSNVGSLSMFDINGDGRFGIDDMRAFLSGRRGASKRSR